ncbi:UNC-like C-terminal-domain-containing protein [Chaetomidium leptoderma]|uniref:UNC-like C-terminal-domain-containing protein n=1 Tax=Chaetomidium leptoderma TaxID=669021 RepID=A0AAN6VP61_9PEZI|nr:UNC-like C-terminal-domain-containing protein [Chaetomidium leptoderma]
MRAPANWASTFAPALALLGLHAVGAHGSRAGSVTAVTAAPAATEVCESRTINYITHTLPQQCLRTSWTSPAPTATDNATVQATVTTTTTATPVSESPGAAQDNATAQDQDGQEELAASSFMSFEEWKEMMLRKSGQDPTNIKPHKPREHRERDPAMNNGDMDSSFGEEGEISLDFDALAEKVSEITSPPSGEAVPNTDHAVKEEQVFYDDGKTQYYRSKDAGKTCKERFSFASFDAGAMVLKTSPGAKNAKAILVENKDSYMLLECRAKSKFVIVELSDDILVDTVVLANFEFFSSMIRKFRVSVSDRYPVKLEKWVDLGTFEARNSRDIQAFLIEHPQIYTKYIRIEVLNHWGNEFYCPLSLLRVHGTRMLDTWKEPNHDDEPEQIQGSPQDPVVEPQQVQEPMGRVNSSQVTEEELVPQPPTDMGLTPWRPVFQSNFSLEMCELRSPTTAPPTPVKSGSSNSHNQPAAAPDSVTPRPSAAPGADEGSPPSSSSSSEPASPEASVPQGQSASTAASSAPSTPPNDNTTSNPTQKRSDSGGTDAADNSSSTTTATSRNKTNSASSASASPTVQESFFKTMTKRLQLLESNTSLSLQYIEEQSRFLQEVLLKIERKQVMRVDAFLDTLNKTVLSELRNVRTQYDQIWQSTVLALETQREQSQRETVALTSRLNILADEVVFQKRMAILQSVLLLSCLVLVIFSRGGLAALDSASFPAFPPTTTPSNSRYGYARSDSLSGMSMTPLDPNGAATATSDTKLGASALPRRLYPSAAVSSYKDKTLPLTPPSEYSRDSTPATHRRYHHLNHSPEASFYQQGEDEEEDDNDNRLRSAESTPLRRQQSGPGGGGGALRVPQRQEQPEQQQQQQQTTEAADTEVSSSIETEPPPPREGEGEEEAVAEDEEAADDDKPPLLRAPRSTIGQLGGLRKKPLPALPEDPS